MSQCTTTHGQYRCEREAGHKGDCEVQSREPVQLTLEQRVRVLEVQMQAMRQRRQ